MSSEPNTDVARLREDEIPELLRVKAQVYGVAPDESTAYYRWKFFENPHRDDRVPFWVLREDGRIVGGIGALPVRMRVFGKERRGEFACEMFIERGRQRSGLGSVLMDAYIADSPWPLMMNTSPSLHRFLVKRGFIDLSAGVRFRVRPIRPGALLARRWGGARAAVARAADPFLRGALAIRGAALRPRRDPGIAVEPVEGFGPWAEEVREAAMDDRPIVVIRDLAYLRWKYERHPNWRYRILKASRSGRPLGYATFRLRASGSGRLAVVQEIFAPRPEGAARRALLEHVVDEARREGADAVKVLATDPVVGADLHATGFLPTGASPGFLVPRQEGLDGPEVLAIASWALTGGDSDLDYEG